MNITEKFINLINLKQEGSYWDFKKEWYSHDIDKKSDLVHDIICMANNQVDLEAYIFIGIEDKTFEIIGVDNDLNRWDTQKLVDLMKDLKFYGDVRPVVHVENFLYHNKTIDVIVIERTNNTPFILKENYFSINRNNVYTRIQDTNTPKNSSADIDKQEYLWKKRFGINKSIMERLHIVLEDYCNWGYYNSDCEFITGDNFGNVDIIFNRFQPEFRMEILKDSYRNWDCETMKCFYCNLTAGSYKCNIYYGNTVIYTFTICHVDEYRKFLVCPKTDYFLYEGKEYYFYYMLEDSIEGKIQKILTRGTFNTESRGHGKYWLIYLKNEKKLSEFKKYAVKSKLICENIKSGTYEIGAEKYANIKISDINNAYRIYMEYLTSIKGFEIPTDYFYWYNCLKK